jgi:hypothetical protein
MTVPATPDNTHPIDAGGMDNQGPELDRLQQLLGLPVELDPSIPTDPGFEFREPVCTCTLVKLAVYHGDNMAPEEWEQNPWCRVHPDVRAIHDLLFELAEDWQGAADADDTHPHHAHTLAACSKELHEVLRRGAL